MLSAEMKEEEGTGALASSVATLLDARSRQPVVGPSPFMFSGLTSPSAGIGACGSLPHRGSAAMMGQVGIVIPFVTGCRICPPIRYWPYPTYLLRSRLTGKKTPRMVKLSPLMARPSGSFITAMPIISYSVAESCGLRPHAGYSDPLAAP